ncbi:hypothetical protein LTR62_005229 [Meristemomyces frigidus]|uniref:Protein kinase domain-containing protein n=1 Tax=Meristemomyces frigidus TaxID=1508187 RepID=A0AAN7YJG5_9PEZI|nr:hypothetical protein LTR62_005229 [Meristemomyces frigidus]
MVREHPSEPFAAEFLFKHTSLGDRVRRIYSNEEYGIGRADIQYLFDSDEPTISSHHLRIHCVSYENGEDQTQFVAPLVYVRVLATNPVIHECSCFNNTSVLARSNRDVLLNDRDVLVLSPRISVTFSAPKRSLKSASAFSMLQEAEMARFGPQYLVSDRILGSGGHANVHLALQQSGKSQLACKIVRVPSCNVDLMDDPQCTDEAREQALRWKKRQEELAREYNVLSNLSHPNIISLEKVFCTTSNIYIFQELVTGGDLMSYLDKNGALQEPEAAAIVRQVSKAVEYLHANNIVHRDIKPENVLMTSWRPGARVVLTDFGQSRSIADNSGREKQPALFRMQSMVGTHGYVAPEVFKHFRRDPKHSRGYSKAIDIWSVGCLAGILLTGEAMPFLEDSQESTAWSLNFMHDDMHPKYSLWCKASRAAKSFIEACLNIDEAQRPTAPEALQHDWFTNKYYGIELEAAYQRAIQDWRPRPANANLIEFIDTSEIPRNVEQVSSQSSPLPYDTQVRSHHFGSKMTNEYRPLLAEAISKSPTTRPAVPAFNTGSFRNFPEVPIDLPSEGQTPFFASPVYVPNTPPPASQMPRAVQ